MIMDQKRRLEQKIKIIIFCLKHLFFLRISVRKFPSVGRLTQLTSLELAGDWIKVMMMIMMIIMMIIVKSSAVSELANLAQLEHLKMPGSEQVTSGDFKALFTKLKKLRLVDVSECKKGVTDMSLIALVKNNPDLEYLAVDECELVTGKAWVNILPNLKISRKYHYSILRKNVDPG